MKKNEQKFLKRIVKASKCRKVILKNYLSPGDIIMMTAAIRDLKIAHQDIFVDVRTSHKSIWDNNPYITSLDENDNDVEVYKVDYPLIHRSNRSPWHFIHGFRKDIENKLKLSIEPTSFWGDIHLSEEEKEMISPVEPYGVTRDYWIMVAGGKYDFTAKWWNPDYFQEVVNHFEGRIIFVQTGHKNHWHPTLEGVVNMVGKTSIREYIRLMYHSVGVISPVTLAMHLAAAVEVKKNGIQDRPCVVISGGREPTQWEAYPNHRFLSTTGCLSCCKNGGCWKSRCQRVGDKNPKDEKSLCVKPVRVKNDLYIPKCMDMIKPFDVIRGVELYYEGDLLTYSSSKIDLAPAKKPGAKKILVVSFQRSGTHFLINTISDNIEGVDRGWVDVINTTGNKWVNSVTPDNLPSKIREQLIEKYYPHEMSRCVKTHYQGSVFEKNIDEILKYYDIFYIIRDPRDNMVSCYNFYNKTNFEDFIKEPDFSKFIRKDISSARTETQPFSYSIKKANNIVKKWYQHVNSWIKLKEKGVHFIKYEDLKYDFEKTMKQIEEVSSQKLKKTLVQVPLSDERYRPDYKSPLVKRGEVGTWKDYFNFSDLQWLKNNLNKKEIAPYYKLNYAPYDIILKHYCKKTDFFFIQIGSFDGKRCDPVYQYVTENHWHGILIEPQKEQFERLIKNYKNQKHLKFENVAISDKKGTGIIYNLPTDKIYGSLLKDGTSYLRKNNDILVTEEVSCVTIHDIIDKYEIKNITLLSIDVEGYELQILESIDFSIIKPTIIYFEKCHLGKDKFEKCIDILNKQGYIVFEDNNVNAIAIIREEIAKDIIEKAERYARQTFFEKKI